MSLLPLVSRAAASRTLGVGRQNELGVAGVEGALSIVGAA
jgi:hypothetical protein